MCKEYLKAFLKERKPQNSLQHEICMNTARRLSVVLTLLCNFFRVIWYNRRLPHTKPFWKKYLDIADLPVNRYSWFTWPYQDRTFCQPDLFFYCWKSIFFCLDLVWSSDGSSRGASRISYCESKWAVHTSLICEILNKSAYSNFLKSYSLIINLAPFCENKWVK